MGWPNGYSGVQQLGLGIASSIIKKSLVMHVLRAHC